MFRLHQQKPIIAQIKNVAPSSVPNVSSHRDIEIVEVELESSTVQPAETEVNTSVCTDDPKQSEAEVTTAADESQRSSILNATAPASSALRLNKPSGLSLEDPVKMMDSILNENGAISQNINLLGK